MIIIIVARIISVRLQLYMRLAHICRSALIIDDMNLFMESLANAI